MHKSSRFALPLITRPTEHAGVTFGAATSVLITGGRNTFGVMRYKNGGGLDGIHKTKIAECQAPRGLDLPDWCEECFCSEALKDGSGQLVGECRVRRFAANPTYKTFGVMRYKNGGGIGRKCRNPGRGVSVKPGIVPQRGFDLQNWY